MRELGISVTAYGVMSRGLLTGSPITSPKDFRKHFPRFQGENFEKNRAIVSALNAIAKSMNATAAADGHCLGDVARRGNYSAYWRDAAQAIGRILGST